MSLSPKSEIVSGNGLDSSRSNAPEPYDFHDWQAFKESALRYHTTMFPEKDEVDDRIRTFRRLMAPETIRYLRSKRPGMFEFDEFDTWNDWLTTATILLSARDASLSGSPEDPSEDTAESWAGRYRDGNMSERELWLELKALVDKELISTKRQLQVFWDAHSWEKQRKLVKRCPHFDPSDRAWDASTSYADRTAAQRLVNGCMQSDVDASVNGAYKVLKVLFVMFCVSTILAISMFILLAHLKHPSLAVIQTLAVIGSLSGAVAGFLLIMGLLQFPGWRSARELQKKYSLGVWPNTVRQSGEGLLRDAENIDAAVR